MACPAEDAENHDTISVKVSDADYAQGYVDIYGLSPEAVAMKMRIKGWVTKARYFHDKFIQAYITRYNPI